MKKTDIEKNKALKLMGKLNASAVPGRFAGAAPVVDRREQRRLDQAAGLVSFPVKLQHSTLDTLRTRAATEGVQVNELINTLLADALKA